MKKKMVLFCVAALLLCMALSVAMAENWVCSSCGETNTGNFCSNCGQKKPSPAPSTSQHTISNIGITVQDNGDVLMHWDDSAAAPPYDVYYTIAGWNSPQYNSIGYQGTSVTVYHLIPGVTYTLTVANANDIVSTEYTVPRPIYTEFATGGMYLSLSQTKFSLTDLEKNPAASFEVQLRWPRLRYDREYTAKMVLKTPYGYTSKVIRWDTLTLENRYDHYYWTYAMSEWMESIEADYGSVPTGDYTFEFYLDGQLYDYASFTLGW